MLGVFQLAACLFELTKPGRRGHAIVVVIEVTTGRRDKPKSAHPKAVADTQ